MKDVKKCKKCGEYYNNNNNNKHECNDIFIVHYSDGHGDGDGDDEEYMEEIRAHDFEDCAEKFAIMYNEEWKAEDMPLLNGLIEIGVEHTCSGEIKTFEVFGEAQIIYYCNEKKI